MLRPEVFDRDASEWVSLPESPDRIRAEWLEYPTSGRWAKALDADFEWPDDWCYDELETVTRAFSSLDLAQAWVESTLAPTREIYGTVNFYSESFEIVSTMGSDHTLFRDVIVWNCGGFLRDAGWIKEVSS